MPAAIFVPAQLNDLGVDVALSSVAQGDLLYRGATKWNNLAAGAAAGRLLQSGGAGANPSWSGAGLQWDEANQRLGVGVVPGTDAQTATIQSKITTATTNAAVDAFALEGVSSGTVANNFGVNFRFLLASDAGTLRSVGTIQYFWVTAADASRAPRYVVNLTASSGGLEAFRSEHDGTVIHSRYPGNAPASASLAKLGIGSAISGGSASGTMLGINAQSGYTGDITHYQINGVTQFKLGAGVLEQRNGTTAQALRVYNTTDSGTTNYERGVLQWSSNVLQVGTEAGGTGTARSVVLRAGGQFLFSVGSVSVGSWHVAATGNLVAGTDNSFDIGTAGAVRPRNLHLSGYMLGQRLVEANTATTGSPNVLVAAETRTVLTNEGATALNQHTLPSAAAGYEFTFVVQDSDGIRVVAAAGDTIRIAANVSAAAGRIDSTTIGDAVQLQAINATEWVAIGVVGAGWTVT